ncbi:hypothetical protein LY76DRAFT_74142 [Colletotrichum caudatum]|nr:hypothetical protein LY76DRAFT_74142 [Colletotrichum caudatum]
MPLVKEAMQVCTQPSPPLKEFCKKQHDGLGSGSKRGIDHARARPAGPNNVTRSPHREAAREKPPMLSRAPRRPRRDCGIPEGEKGGTEGDAAAAAAAAAAIVMIARIPPAYSLLWLVRARNGRDRVGPHARRRKGFFLAQPNVEPKGFRPKGRRRCCSSASTDSFSPAVLFFRPRL